MCAARLSSGVYVLFYIFFSLSLCLSTVRLYVLTAHELNIDK